MDKYDRMILTRLSQERDFMKSSEVVISLGVSYELALALGPRFQQLADEGLIHLTGGVNVRITPKGLAALQRPD